MATPAFGLAQEQLHKGPQGWQPEAPSAKAAFGAAPLAPDGQQPYGLALELATGNGGLNPMAIRPAAAPFPNSAAARRQQASIRRAAQPQPAPLAHPKQEQPVPVTGFVPPFGGAEPDYGLVAELRGDHPTGLAASGADGAPRADFGLAAEVARRRARPDVFPAQGVVGGGLAVRPRRRLAAAGPPADFGLADEIAARAVASKDRDPFSDANRASRVDPFLAADHVLKFPTAPYVPHTAADQVRHTHTHAHAHTHKPPTHTLRAHMNLFARPVTEHRRVKNASMCVCMCVCAGGASRACARVGAPLRSQSDR